MHLVIALPALNESSTIVDVLGKIPKEFSGIKKTTVIVVDDGSTDNTALLATESGALVINHSHNKGVGAAFHTAVRESLLLAADIMVNIDADGQFNPSDINKLIKPIVDGEADFVTASRFKDISIKPEMPWVKYMGNKFMSWLISKLTKRKFYDVSCGFRAYSKETLLRINLFGKFTYTQETFIDLVFKCVRILEIPIPVLGVRKYGKSRVASNLFKYGMNSLRIILHSFIDYKPLSIFGFLAFFMFLIGMLFGCFFLVHYILTGKFSPHIWAGFVSGFFLTMSFLIAVFSLLGDMLSRIRLNQEEILYYLKKKGN